MSGAGQTVVGAGRKEREVEQEVGKEALWGPHIFTEKSREALS